MLQEAESKQNSDILQQAVNLVKENQRLAAEKEKAEEQIKNLAKFCTENPNPVLRIEISGKLLFSNTPGRVLLEDHAIETGDQVPEEFQKMVSFAHSSQSIKQCETTVGSQTFFLQWVPILNEGYVNVYGQNITRRKKAEQALQESEIRANAVLSHAIEGFITIDEQGTIQSFNPAAEKLFGYQTSEILGKNITHLIPEPFRSGHEQGLKNYLETGVSKVIGIGAEVVGLRKDGSTFPLDLGISEMFIGETRMFTGIIRDITERKKAERALQESETRANAVLNNAVDGIITIDEQGTIQSFNPAAERLFSYKTSELLGVNIKLLMPEPFHSEHDRYLQNYLETGVSKVIGIGREVIGLRKDGSTFPADLEISEMYLGESRMFTGTVRDITERKKAEAEQQMQYELTRTFLDSQSLDNSLPKILQVIGEFMEWEIGYYWEKKPGADELHCRYAWNASCLNESVAFKEFKENSFTRTFEKGAGLPGRVWDKLEPYRIANVIVDTNFPRAPFAEKLGMKSGFGFPVYFKKQFMGVIEMFTRQVCRPDPHLIEMMANLGGQIGQWMRLKKAEEHLDKLNLKTFD